ncbi:hypothetical protein AVEN_237931-1 [Araneus ventricosus]|uniref:RING-type domain-containing protein n=2 Tax=Araneus ventricosus TaxID=182803 RepID=A0A4Y2V7P5_ARAVE|nr:hypothetical protein AVEN_237931-1 [Araneus ventricosus]
MRRNGYKEPSDLWFGSFIHSADMDAFHVPLTCYKCEKRLDRVELPCGHYYHSRCLVRDNGARMECPVCRTLQCPCFVCMKRIKLEDEPFRLSCGCIHHENCLFPRFAYGILRKCPKCKKGFSKMDQFTMNLLKGKDVFANNPSWPL